MDVKEDCETASLSCKCRCHQVCSRSIDVSNERLRFENHNIVRLHKLAFLRSYGDSFSLVRDALSQRFTVLLGTLEEVLTASRVPDMLETNANCLQNLSLSNSLLEVDAKRARRDVEDLTGATVIEVVGHTFVNCRVHDHVHEVATSVDVHRLRRRRHAMLPKLLSELLAGASAATE